MMKSRQKRQVCLWSLTMYERVVHTYFVRPLPDLNASGTQGGARR
jgi:hypothetical protein